MANDAIPKRPPIPDVPDAAARVGAVRAKVRENQLREEPVMPDDRYLALLSIDAGIDIEVLAARLPDGSVRIDQQSSLRVVSCEASKAFLDAHHAAQQAERERLERQRAQVALTNTALSTRERVRRLAARQSVAADADLSAYATMISADPDNPLERSGSHMSEMLAGATSMTYHRVRQED
jgi:hypothetical protein